MHSVHCCGTKLVFCNNIKEALLHTSFCSPKVLIFSVIYGHQCYSLTFIFFCYFLLCYFMQAYSTDFILFNSFIYLFFFIVLFAIRSTFHFAARSHFHLFLSFNLLMLQSLSLSLSLSAFLFLETGVYLFPILCFFCSLLFHIK